MRRLVSWSWVGVMLIGCPSGGGGEDALVADAARDVGPREVDLGQSDSGSDAAVFDGGWADAGSRDAVADAEASDAGGPDGGGVDAGPPVDCPAVVGATEVEALDELTAALAVAGHLDGARCAAERFVAALPQHPLALNNLAFVLLEAGEAQGALDLLRPLPALWPDAAPILQNLALAASQVGDHVAALEAAEALVAAEPEDRCTGEVVRAVVRLRAGEGDEEEARQLIEGECDRPLLWQRLADEGHVAPAPPRTAICIPVPGAPDRRSTCPNGGGCFDPVVFAAPDCATHPDVCAAQPYWRSFSLGEDAQPTFGVITGERVLVSTVDLVTVSCEDEEECFIITSPQPPRGLTVNLAGPAVSEPRLSLPMLAGEGLAVGAYFVVFPMFPQRVIHPSAAGPEVGCPGMQGPFYHFDSESDLEAAARETVARLEVRRGFEVDARARVSGFAPTYAWTSAFWEDEVCPQQPYLQCQDASLSPPIGGGLPDLPPGCAEGFLNGLEELQDLGGPDTLLMDISTSSLQCDLPGPRALEGGDFDPVRAILTAALPPAGSTAVLFSAPTGVIEITLDSVGKLNTTLRGGLVTFDGGVGLLDGGFDARLGVGPAVNVGRLAGFDLTVGIGIRGDLGERSVDQIYGNVVGSACFGGRAKFSVDRALGQVDLDAVTQRLSQGFSASPGRQVALSSRP